MGEEEVRIDKWLWAMRLFKTRSQATQACLGGHVKVEEKSVKPARIVHPGDMLVIHLPDITRTVQIRETTDKRVAARLVEKFLEDLTPDSEYERRKEFWSSSPAQRARGTGRPTKKERRTTDRFFGL
jgi:ribosome-associated heat shock protein Hsp15